MRVRERMPTFLNDLTTPWRLDIEGCLSMSQQVWIELAPSDLIWLHLPKGVKRRLQFLLDCQDRGERLTVAEQMEAEGLVSLSEWLSLVRLLAKRARRES